MRVAVYAIAMNELRHVERFVMACRGADAVVVADTGSTDGTAEALAARGVLVHRIGIKPWRFDDARNVSLALVPADIDVCIALDLDEVLNPGWRAALAQEWQPEHTRGRYFYAWSHKPDGSPAVAFWCDKIHARHGYRWRHPCHEALYPDRLTEHSVALRGLRVDHWPDDSKPRSQYLSLLEAAVSEDRHDSRNAYYLGREYYLRQDWPKAEAELQRYLALPTSRWGLQNSAAMRFLGRARLLQKDYAGAEMWLRRATEAAPEMRDPWVDLADALYWAKDYAGCFAAAARALAITSNADAGFTDPRSHGPHPHDLASFSAWQIGRREDALTYAISAAAHAPGDARLAGNVTTIRRLLAEQVSPADAEIADL